MYIRYTNKRDIEMCMLSSKTAIEFQTSFSVGEIITIVTQSVFVNNNYLFLRSFFFFLNVEVNNFGQVDIYTCTRDGVILLTSHPLM